MDLARENLGFAPRMAATLRANPDSRYCALSFGAVSTMNVAPLLPGANRRVHT
jgi:hypothetical protein